jgi:hypothetical protein
MISRLFLATGNFYIRWLSYGEGRTAYNKAKAKGIYPYTVY